MNILKTEPSFKLPFFGWAGSPNAPIAAADSAQDFINKCLIRDPK